MLAAVLFIPVFSLIAWQGRYFFVLFVNAVVLIGMYEYLRLVEAKGVRPSRLLSYGAAAILPWLAYLQGGAYWAVGLGVVVLAIMALELFRRSGQPLIQMAVSVFGVLYVVWLASHLVFLRELPLWTGHAYGTGFRIVILTFLVVWMSDTGAYLVGSAIGRHKLAPRISPGKSIEGAIGGLLFAVATGWVTTLVFMQDEITPLAGAGLGVLAAVSGLTGDLVESLIKRDVNVKDASAAIPGHGGVLDRFDSVLFAAPLLYYALRFLVF